jgi:hypothetical protein
MLRKWLVLYAPDANTDESSSNSSDANGQDSSTAKTEQDVVEEAVGKIADVKSDETDEDSGEENADDTDTEKGDESSDDADGADDQEGQTDDKAEDEVQAIVDKPEDEKLDFHKHPRFQELITEKNAIRQEVEQLKPLAQRAKILDDFVQTNGISQQQLTNALEYTRLINSDPLKAYELLKPIYNQLATYAGDVLPADLQAEVAAATLSPERARELATARARNQYGDWQGQNRSQSEIQRNEQQIQGSIDGWAASTMKTDADFRPKANGGVDGKWELVDMKLRSLRQANPPKNGQDAVALVQQAYDEANKFFNRFTPAKKIVKRPLASSAHNSNTTGVLPKNPDDATKSIVAAVMGGRKPHQMRYATK